LLVASGALELLVVLALARKRFPTDIGFAAILIVVVIGIFSLTDNLVLYIMAMMPAAIVVASARAVLKLEVGQPIEAAETTPIQTFYQATASLGSERHSWTICEPPPVDPTPRLGVSRVGQSISGGFERIYSIASNLAQTWV